MKKILSALLALSVVTGLLSSCSSSAGSSGSTQSNKPVTLTFMDHTDEQGTKNWEDQTVKDFHKKYPNITIDIQRMSFDNYNTSLQTKIASGDAPDMFYTEGDQMKKFNKNSYLLDITSQPFIKNFEASNLAQLTIDNKVVGIGLSVGSMCVIYNKDVFEKAGISAVPTTLDDFYADCEKIKATGVSAIAHGYKEAWMLDADMQADYITAVLSKDKNSIINLESRKTKFTNSEDWKGVFTRLARRYSYSNSDAFGTGSNDAYSLVATGKTAMVLNGIWAVSGVKGINSSANLGIFALPNSNSAADTKLLIQAPTQGISIYSGTEHKDECLKYFASITTPEAGAAYSKQAVQISAIKGVVAPSEPAFKDVYSYIDKSNTFNQGSIDHNFSNECRTSIEKEVSAFLAKNMTVDQLCKNLDSDFDTIASSNN